MRKVFFAAALAGLAAAHSGCALIAGYDFGKYGERAGEGGGGAAASTSSASGAGGAGSAMSSVSSTGAGQGGSPAMTVLYAGLDQPTSLAIDADAVYFTASADPFKPISKVMRVTKDGASSIKLATGEISPLSVTVDATHAYWLSGPMQDGSIKRAAKMGGASVEVLFDTMESLGGVAGEGQALYFTTVLSDSVWTLPTSGGSPAMLLTGQTTAGELAADASGIYWVNRGTASQSNGAVMRADLDGSNVKTLASGQKFPLRIALDQGNVYWATLDGAASGIDKAGKTPAFTYVFAGSGPPVAGLAADGAHVYYSLNKDVFKVPVNSLSAEKIVSGFGNPKDLAVDATSLYVAGLNAAAEGLLIKVPK